MKRYWFCKVPYLPSEIANMVRQGYLPAPSAEIQAGDVLVVHAGLRMLSFYEALESPRIQSEEGIYVTKVQILKERIPDSVCRRFVRLTARNSFPGTDLACYADEIEKVLNDPKIISDPNHLLTELGLSETFEDYLSRYRNAVLYSDPVGYLTRCAEEKGLSVAEIGRRSHQEDYIYKIFKGLREPRRDVLLSIGIGMKLSVDEIQELLRLYRFAPLSVTDEREAIILFGILKGMGLDELNDLLHDYKKDTFA